MKPFVRRHRTLLAACLLLTCALAVGGVAFAVGHAVAPAAQQTGSAALTPMASGGDDPAAVPSTLAYSATNTPGAVTGSSSAQSSDAKAPSSQELALPPDSSTPDRFLERTGDMSIVVAKGQVPATAAKITSLVTGYGGYILSSQITTAAGVSPSADLSVRVPSRLYQTAIARFAELGAVQSVNTSTVDVTGQVVDLQARLAHYRAVDARLLTFLAHAGSITQALAIQDRIDATQLKVDQFAAQLKSMHEQTAYGTLAVSLGETPAVVAGHTRNSFLAAMSRSWHRMVDGFGTIVVAIGALLPFAVLVALAAAAVWAARRAARTRRRPAEQ